MWTYKIKCRSCTKTYLEHPETLYIGPIFDEIVTAEEHVEGLASFVTEELYKGNTLKIGCPYCLLRVIVASDLAPWTLRRYLPSESNIDAIIEYTDAVAKIRAFPVRCPRCDRTIREAGESKKCKHCGSEQLNIVSLGAEPNHRLDTDG